jgi:hypothetical protein
MKVKVSKPFRTIDGKMHREGEVINMWRSISKEEYRSYRARFEDEEHAGLDEDEESDEFEEPDEREDKEEREEKEDIAFENAFEDKIGKRE